VPEIDPYRPPSAQIVAAAIPAPGDVPALANRWLRLAANLIDGVIYGVASMPLFFCFALLSDPELRTQGSSEPLGAVQLAWIGSLLFGTLLIGIFVINLIMLHRNGWTMAKRLLRIRIVRLDYSRAGLPRIFFLRMLIPTLLSLIPCVGPIWSLLDPCMIFRQDRRCLHDHLADTIVVEA
jgi:uncharacterized RDD family membrane protein YckC